MTIRPTEIRDIDAVTAIFDTARAFMRRTGNMSQWNDGYPDAGTVRDDTDRGVSYVCENDEGRVIATFCLIQGEDPTYRVIDGRWLDDSRPYATVHRLASDGSSSGIFRHCMDWCLDKCDNIRVDTHEDNRVMRSLLMKYGFTECGVIRLANGDPRIAYQKCVSR